MKKFFILATVIMAASCSVLTQQPHERYVESYFMDFRPYQEIDFFISPNPFTGEYTSLGELSISVYPAVLDKSKKQGVKTFDDGLYGGVTTTLVKEVIPASELIDYAVSKALELGANGICNFRCEKIYNTEYTRDGNRTIFSHYEISGLCISIKSASKH